jgi:hypothetical protein
VSAGPYVITDVFEIDRARIVLRGKGPERSILGLPKPHSQTGL